MTKIIIIKFNETKTLNEIKLTNRCRYIKNNTTTIILWPKNKAIRALETIQSSNKKYLSCSIKIEEKIKEITTRLIKSKYWN